MSYWNTAKPFVPSETATGFVRRANAPRKGVSAEPPAVVREPLYMKRGEPKNIPRFNEYGIRIPKSNVESYMPGLGNSAVLWSPNYNAYEEAKKKRNNAVALYETTRKNAMARGPPAPVATEPVRGMKRSRATMNLSRLFANNNNNTISNTRKSNNSNNRNNTMNRASKKPARRTRRATRRTRK
jgi:hypothetical protein